MKYIKYVINVLVQCTWGSVQTIIGLFFFIKYRNCPHNFYKGSIETKWNLNHYSGLSLGLFIFTPDENSEFFKEWGLSDKEISDDVSRCRVHEYGHMIQSFMLGPFMLIPGVISVAWGRMKKYEKLRKEYNVPYSFCWTEAWANKLGEKMTGLPALKD